MNALKFILDYLFVFVVLGLGAFVFIYLLIDMIKTLIDRYKNEKQRTTQGFFCIVLHIAFNNHSNLFILHQIKWTT